MLLVVNELRDLFSATGHRNKRPFGIVRTEEGQGQQGHHRLQHHVHRGAISTLPPRTLALLEDSREQIVRVHARDPRGSAGHGLRHFHQDFSQVQEAICSDSGTFCCSLKKYVDDYNPVTPRSER